MTVEDADNAWRKIKIRVVSDDEIHYYVVEHNGSYVRRYVLHREKDGRFYPYNNRGLLEGPPLTIDQARELEKTTW